MLKANLSPETPRKQLCDACEGFLRSKTPTLNVSAPFSVCSVGSLPAARARVVQITPRFLQTSSEAGCWISLPALFAERFEAERGNSPCRSPLRHPLFLAWPRKKRSKGLRMAKDACGASSSPLGVVSGPPPSSSAALQVPEECHSLGTLLERTTPGVLLIFPASLRSV